LPIDAGEFYSDHVLPCKRENVFIDLKNSSHKKLGKFLQVMMKLDLIEYKESKKGAAPQITRINRGNPRLSEFEPVVSKAAKKDREEEVSAEDKWPKVEITEIYKPKASLSFFFPDYEDKNKFYTKEEIQTVIMKYVNENKLIEKKFIKIDSRLQPLYEEPKIETQIVEGEEKPKKSTQERVMTRENLFNKLDDLLNPYYKVNDLIAFKSDTKAGKFKGIHLIAEKAHNKNVTRITGMEQFGFNIPHITTKFQLRYACSVSTHAIQENKVEKKEVVVHGNFLNELMDYFADECKIDRKYMTSVNKLEKKKKNVGMSGS